MGQIIRLAGQATRASAVTRARHLGLSHNKIDVKMAKMLALALLVGAQAFVNNPARSLRNFGLHTATRSPAAPQMLFGLSLKVRPT